MLSQVIHSPAEKEAIRSWFLSSSSPPFPFRLDSFRSVTNPPVFWANMRERMGRKGSERDGELWELLGLARAAVDI